MKSLKEQVQSKCIHFNGIGNKECRAGISYDIFRGDERPFRFPCLSQGGECTSLAMPTDEEVELTLQEIEESTSKTIGAYLKIKSHYQKTKEQSGAINCQCGGKLKYTVAKLNGHIWAHCSSCKLFFNE